MTGIFRKRFFDDFSSLVKVGNGGGNASTSAVSVSRVTDSGCSSSDHYPLGYGVVSHRNDIMRTF